MRFEEENLETIIINFFNENYGDCIKKDERDMIKESLESHGIQVADLEYFLSFGEDDEEFNAKTFCYLFKELVDINNKEENPLAKIFVLSVPYEAIYNKLSNSKEKKLKMLGELRKKKIENLNNATEQEKLSLKKLSENSDIIYDLLFWETGYNLKGWRMNLGAFLGRQETEAIKRSDDIFLKFRYNIKSLYHFDDVHQYPYNKYHYDKATHSWSMLINLVLKNFQELNSRNFQKEMGKLLNTSDLSYENIVLSCFEKTLEKLKKYEEEIKENQETLQETFSPQYDEWFKENLKHKKIISGLKGDIYLHFGEFISESREKIREKNLEEKLIDILNSLSIKTDDNNLSKQAFSKAKEQYKESRKLGNEERENDSKLGVACSCVATSSNKAVEKYENFLEAILNCEVARGKENIEIENDAYIANSYQEVGHLISCLDIFLNPYPSEVREIINFTRNLVDKTNKLYGFLENLIISEGLKFGGETVRNAGIKILEHALEEYNKIHIKRKDLNQDIQPEDYSYRGKCKLRLSKLKHSRGTINGAIEDLEKAIFLRDKSATIYNLLGGAYFVLAHNYIHSNNKEKEEKFLKALKYFNISSNISRREGTTKRENYNWIAECYRHLAKLEFKKENSNPRLFNKYLNKAISYAQKTDRMIK